MPSIKQGIEVLENEARSFPQTTKIGSHNKRTFTVFPPIKTSSIEPYD